MLRVTVGKSRKLSQDYNSTGFSITVDGEITAPLDSPEQILAQVQILHDLASESLQDQIDRLKDTDQKNGSPSSRPATNVRQQEANGQASNRPRWQTQNGHAKEFEGATGVVSLTTASYSRSKCGGSFMFFV